MPRFLRYAATGCVVLLCCQLHATSPTPSVSRIPRDQIVAISGCIDQLVQKQLTERGRQPNLRIDDQTFLRRVYLDIAGRIPTLDEARAFLNSKQPAKRAALIDQLLDSPAYQSHQYNYWADLLRLKTRLNGGNPGQPYIDYVKSSLAENKPYDQLVRELLAASGPVLERGNGATGYYLRDSGMPEDNMANTVRIFLGTRLECAQCHDHPFDKWTQREFYEMVAFTGGMRTRIAPTTMRAGLEMRRQLRQSDASAKIKQAATRILRPLSYGVSGGGTGLARLPDSYQYDDGEPNEIVTAKTMFEHEALVRPTIPPPIGNKQRRRKGRFASAIPRAQDINSREAFADWLTSADNPRFTTVIANRLWKKAMGLGLIEPVDEMTDDTEASNPELMSYLTEQMKELDYDMKQFLRAIYHSDTYQSESAADDLTNPSEYDFAGPVLRRMTAEQLWDSFLSLAVVDLDQREGPGRRVARGLLDSSDIYEGFEKIKQMSLEEVLQLAKKQVAMMEDPQQRRKRYREMMMAGQPPENGPQAKRLRAKASRLRELVKQARRRRDPQAVRRLQVELRNLSNAMRPSKMGADMVRASELPSPAPPGHFVREFGQSDRDQIDNANTEPAISQVLSLMNGTIEKRIISNPRTVLMKNLVAADSLQERIDVAFLSMLSRYATPAERATWQDAARQHGHEAAHDLIWTLANTTEFMFVR